MVTNNERFCNNKKIWDENSLCKIMQCMSPEIPRYEGRNKGINDVTREFEVVLPAV